MPTVETKIWLALKSRVDTISLTYTKAWPAQKFELPTSGGLMSPYLRIGRVSVPPVRELVASGKPHLRTGSLIVTLVHPLGANFSAFDEIGGKIAEHFKDGTQMHYQGVCVSIVDYPNCQEGYEDNGFWTLPVVIQWRCFA